MSNISIIKKIFIFMREEFKMICPKCGAQVNDNSSFCTSCGNSIGGGNPQMGAPMGNPQMGMPQQVYYVNPTDHTAEFDAKDISDNKVMAMMPYLMGTIGIIIALLASRESAYAYFHVRQALKLTVVTTLLGIISGILLWTFIVPLVGAICVVIVFVIRIICFFQVCGGKAKEPAIISSLGFLK